MWEILFEETGTKEEHDIIQYVRILKREGTPLDQRGHLNKKVRFRSERTLLPLHQPLF